MMTLAKAIPIADEIVDSLEPHCYRIMATGDVRRQMAEVSQIDICLVPRDPHGVQNAIMGGAAALELFGSHLARVVLRDGHTRANFHFAHEDCSSRHSHYPCNWGSQLLFSTGSKPFVDKLIRRAGELDMHWNVHHGLFYGGVVVASATEEEILSRLGFGWVPPEVRG